TFTVPTFVAAITSSREFLSTSMSVATRSLRIKKPRVCDIVSFAWSTILTSTIEARACSMRSLAAGSSSLGSWLPNVAGAHNAKTIAALISLTPRVDCSISHLVNNAILVRLKKIIEVWVFYLNRARVSNTGGALWRRSHKGQFSQVRIQLLTTKQMPHGG